MAIAKHEKLLRSIDGIESRKTDPYNAMSDERVVELLKEYYEFLLGKFKELDEVMFVSMTDRQKVEAFNKARSIIVDMRG